MATMGDRIASARVEAGLMQGEFAQALGVAANTVSRWKTGQRVPNTATLRRIAAATGKPLSYFLSDAPDAQTPAGQQDLAAQVAALAARVDALTGAPPTPPAPVHPGVEALLSDAAECARLQITQEDARRLRGLGDLGGLRVQTVQQAEGMLEQVRLLVPGDNRRDH